MNSNKPFYAIAALGLIWVAFLIGAGSTIIWLLGRWLQVW